MRKHLLPGIVACVLLAVTAPAKDRPWLTGTVIEISSVRTNLGAEDSLPLASGAKVSYPERPIFGMVYTIRAEHADYVAVDEARGNKVPRATVNATVQFKLLRGSRLSFIGNDGKEHKLDLLKTTPH